ncbi:MAG: DUF1737 domain-containing protein [Octadecabacter sp.]|nr:DUF1737 domain-containing protein [Octadecabacter sp.]
MALIYRLLTEDDSSEFCHKISLALSNGWMLYGDPTYAYDHANGVMRAGQAVTKDVDVIYSRDMKLSQQ